MIEQSISLRCGLKALSIRFRFFRNLLNPHQSTESASQLQSISTSTKRQANGDMRTIIWLTKLTFTVMSIVPERYYLFACEPCQYCNRTILDPWASPVQQHVDGYRFHFISSNSKFKTCTQPLIENIKSNYQWSQKSSFILSIGLLMQGLHLHPLRWYD